MNFSNLLISEIIDYGRLPYNKVILLVVLTSGNISRKDC
ncbi:hypothetical protein YN1HA_19340 [Sulfurisphaera ohwakuensis]